MVLAHPASSGQKSFENWDFINLVTKKLSIDFTATEATDQLQIRMLFYIRFSVRVTELLFLSYTAKGFMEYTSPPVDFTSIIVLHEKHFTGPE